MNSSFKKFQEAKLKSLEEIQAAQTTMLHEHLRYVFRNSPFYRKHLADSGIDLERMPLEEISRLPFTEKHHIEANPQAFMAVAPNRIADIVLSSGTTGKPIPIYYTESDLARLAYNEEQSFAGCGIQPGDITLLTCTMDRCFIAGLAYFLGMRERGATVIRNGHGAIESHMDLIRTMKPTIIVGVPTFLKKLGLAMRREGQQPAKAGVQKLVCIGEPLRGYRFEMLGLARDLESLWQAKVYSTYASSETITTFCECIAQRGGHLLPELAYVEIVDENGKVLPPGKVGEIVMTPFAVEGMPLVRYKTGDVSFLEETPCPCGRFSSRLGPILGRKKQLMKVRGTSLYPQSVFSVLEDIKDISHYYLEVFTESELSDRVVVHVSVENDRLTREKIEEKLASKLRVTPEVKIEDDQTMKQKVFVAHSRKPVRFFDRRETVPAASVPETGSPFPLKASDLIPHSGPMCVIEDLLDVRENAGAATACLAPDSPFVRADGSIEETVFIEMIAQTIAAANGYELSESERARQQGYLLGVKKMKVFEGARAGEMLRIEAAKTAEFGDFGIVEGKVLRGDTVLAEGEIKVVQSLKKTEAMGSGEAR